MSSGTPLCFASKINAFFPWLAQESLAFFSTICVAHPQSAQINVAINAIFFILLR
jgi:hypothetical protein